jgi:hypothetical protein
MEGTMRQFQRGLEALDPSNDPLARPDTRTSLRRNPITPKITIDRNGTFETARQQNPASGRDNGSAQER